MTKILIVDDTVDFVKMVSMILGQYGYETAAAYNGIDGLEAAATERPDLILLDHMMPGMSGWDMFQHLRGNDATEHIPVIMITAFSKDYETEREEAQAIGMEDYMTKPLSMPDLISHIAKVLAFDRPGD